MPIRISTAPRLIAGETRKFTLICPLAMCFTRNNPDCGSNSNCSNPKLNVRNNYFEF